MVPAVLTKCSKDPGLSRMNIECKLRMNHSKRRWNTGELRKLLRPNFGRTSGLSNLHQTRDAGIREDVNTTRGHEEVTCSRRAKIASASFVDLESALYT